MSRLAFWTFALCAAALAGCDAAQPATDVNQDRIFVEYELSYSGEEDLTRARALFNFGGPNGTQLRLDEGEVRFDGRRLELVESIANLIYYEDVQADEDRSGTFTFTDADGTSYANEASLLPIAFPDEVGPLDNDESSELTWSGAPVRSGEVVTLTLFRIGTENELAVFRQTTEDARSVVLSRDQLQNVQPGEVTLVLTRERIREAEDAASVGSSVKETYQAPFRTVSVAD